MNKRILMFAVPVVAGMAFVGCDTKSNTPAPATPPSSATPAAPTADAVKTATDAAKTAAANVSADAQKLLDEVTQNIKDNKMQLAEDGLKKLEAMKPSLPADWAPKIDQARSAFDAAKKAAALLPGGAR